MAILCTHYRPGEDAKHCASYISNGACSRPDQLMCSEWLKANGQLPAYRNDHLSYSRLQLFEQCQLAFYRRYVDPAKDKGRPAPQLTFGKTIHKVLELAVTHHVKEELDGPLDLDLALRLYQQEWSTSYLCGAELFEEGARQLRGAIREMGHVSHWDVLGVEQGFELQAGPFKIIGYIDLIQRDGDAVVVTDYKTGALPQPWDVDATLQLTLYDIAVRRLYPWAKEVKLRLHQTRQGLYLWTSRTEDQRSLAMAYCEALGARTEAETDWEATLGGHCGICAWRGTCATYALALEKATPPGTDLDSVALEHLALTDRVKAIKSRLRETEAYLTAALKDVEEIRAGGRTWAQWPTEGLSYPVGETVETLRAAGLESPEKVLTVDKAKLTTALGKIEDPARRQMVKLELDAIAKKRIYPRLWAKGK